MHPMLLMSVGLSCHLRCDKLVVSCVSCQFCSTRKKGYVDIGLYELLATAKKLTDVLILALPASTAE